MPGTNDVRAKAKKFRQMIDAASTISVVGHVRPDGDCIGSCLALYNYILENYKGKKVDVYTESFPASFRILNGARKIHHEPPKQERYDLSISIDVSEEKRQGKFSEVFQTAISTICIDHHVSNRGFGDLCYIDPDASSACEALCDLIDMEQVSKATAECLYLGIVHDTGVFKYSCCRRKTMELAGLLLEKGVKADDIIDGTFYKKTYRQNLLQARTMLESNLYEKGKIITGRVTREMFREFKCTAMDTDGIVEQLRLTDGVEVAVFSYQLNRKSNKFSLRSKNYVDVNAIAGHFGGGGHIRAAGFESDLDFDQVMQELLGLIRENLKA